MIICYEYIFPCSYIIIQHHLLSHSISSCCNYCCIIHILYHHVLSYICYNPILTMCCMIICYMIMCFIIMYCMIIYCHVFLFLLSCVIIFILSGNIICYHRLSHFPSFVIIDDYTKSYYMYIYHPIHWFTYIILFTNLVN